ncbi:Ankyrin repeat domain-containing protein 31 [Triticum urartu]|uniref:Ankyrin repeat domain-containing protein 31 n=1 Tax=Triticum urartu TaxID=4572 RepID=M7ZK10_TRIUA|nr:Ankyrin repeat domain-containing protein 31 [Triticum urartu]
MTCRAVLYNRRAGHFTGRPFYSRAHAGHFTPGPAHVASQEEEQTGELTYQANSAPMETVQKKEAMGTTCPEDNGKDKDGSTTDEKYDPQGPPSPPSDLKSLKEVHATSTTVPDRTPQNGRDMTLGYIIKPEALNELVITNALRFAKLVLVGKNPELHGFGADPNCMTQFGFFPLHRAAEMFSVDMIELLLHHGASANLRTSGALVIDNLLPVHVAVENTCLHKYLENGLHPNQENMVYSHADINYILKLIHILCLPEMKLFLDTTRLLAKHTDNLLDEVCKYIIDGKLIQMVVLLLATQEQIRGVSSSKKDCNSKPDGFAIITNCVVGKITAIQLEMCQKGVELKPLEAKKKLFDMTLTLVHVISQAGEALDSYIRDHAKNCLKGEIQIVSQSRKFEKVPILIQEDGNCRLLLLYELLCKLIGFLLAASFYQDRALTWKVPYIIPVSHVEVLDRVSLILKDYGLCSGEGIDIGNLYCSAHLFIS